MKFNIMRWKAGRLVAVFLLTIGIGMSMSTSAQAAGAHYQGGVNLWAYCQTRGWGDAKAGSGAYDWTCTRTGYGINVSSACAEQYSNWPTYAYGYTPRWWDPYSWSCYKWY